MGKYIQADFWGSLVGQPNRIDEFQASGRPCLKNLSHVHFGITYTKPGERHRILSCDKGDTWIPEAVQFLKVQGGLGKKGSNGRGKGCGERQ